MMTVAHFGATGLTGPSGSVPKNVKKFEVENVQSLETAKDF